MYQANMSKEKVQLVNELHAPARRNFPRRHVVIKSGIGDLWQADLVDMQAYSRKNKGMKYILCVIDVFSKYAWALPLKSKSAKDITVAFKKIIHENTLPPKNLQTDQGKEFYNQDFNALMKKESINHYSTFSVMKASVVERFNRTLKSALWKNFSIQGNYNWIQILPAIIKNYNNTKHRTIGLAPSKVNKSNEKDLLQNVYGRIKIAGRGKFKKGDLVRISKFKHVFFKGYRPNWTTELFKIIKVKVTDPVTYLLEDLEGHPIAGGFYEQELHSVQNPDVYLVEKV